MELFVRESGPVGAPTIVFLHAGEFSSRSWQPVVERMQQYHCLVPDLPQHGRSRRRGPFEMAGAAASVAELIRSRVGTERVHVVGLSLGAQVGLQLLATEPELVDRAVLCGAMVNVLPGLPQSQALVGMVAQMSRSLWFAIGNAARRVWIVPAELHGYAADMRLMAPTDLAQVVRASVGFTIPEGFENTDSPTLFLTGERELGLVHRSAAVLAKRIPNGVDGIVTGMAHIWPLTHPDLFARTVDSWLTDTALPPEVALPNLDRH